MKNNTQFIIADNYQKEEIFRNLLIKDKGLIGTQVISFSLWLKQHQENEHNDINDFILCYYAIQSKIDKLHTLKNAIIYPSFTNEFISFYQTLDKYNIEIDSLPDNTPLEKEIKLLIMAIDTILKKYDKYQQIINRIPDIHNTLIYPTYLNDIADQKIREMLVDNGCKYYTIKQQKPNSLTLYQALNKRQEIEGLAQYLINSDYKLNEIMIVLANPHAYLPWLNSIFQRYNIPYATTITENNSLVIPKYLKLLKLLNTKNTEDFINCLQNQCFELNCPNLIEYLQTFAVTFNECQTEFTNLRINNDINIFYSKQEKAYAQALENKAEIERFHLTQTIGLINNCKDTVFDIATTAYAILKTNPIVNAYPTDFKQIKTLLEENIYDIKDLSLLVYLLEKIQPHHNSNSFNQLLVTKVEHAIGIKRKLMILIGADNAVFPTITYHNGVIDESYYAKLNYPTKNERYDFAIQQIKNIFLYCDDLIISFAFGDYAGKGKKISYELEEIIKEMGGGKFINWPLQDNNYLAYNQHGLSDINSKQIFFENNRLKGSVSSFETYYQCPYRYFIQRGLRIYECDLTINNAKLGVLLHHIIELLINKYGKDYTKCSSLELQQLINECFAELYMIFSNKQMTIDLIKLKFMDTMLRSIKQLAEIEKGQSFQPIATERKFNSTINTKKIPIDLNGIIDRIDIDNDYYRIIDYKSSDHKLSEKEVDNGTQLQLLTYLWLIQEKIQKQPDGVYYFSFSNKVTKVKATNFNRTKHTLTEYDTTDWYIKYQETHQLSGWNFNDLNSVGRTKLYNFNEIKAKLIILYENLVDQLLDGNIAPNPQNNACQYCGYLGICKYYLRYEFNSDDESDD